MIRQTLDFVDRFRIGHQQPFVKILEVGSRKVGLGSGEQLRGMFADADYIGVDIYEGANVDQVVNGHDLIEVFGNNIFDLVLCSDTLEHDDKFWVTAENMRGVLKPEGWMIIAVPGEHCGLHEHPKDYWRFMEAGVRELFADFAELQVHGECWDPANHGNGYDEIFGWGMKPIRG